MSAHIDKVIADLPTLRPNKINEWRDKALRVLERRPDDEDARRLLAAIDARIPDAETAPRLIRVGGIHWEPYDKSGCRGFIDGDPVARIFVEATHTSTRKDVYSLEVLGALSPDRFHRIADARQAAWQTYRDRRSHGG